MRRFILLAGLAAALGVLLPGSGLTDVGGSDLPFKGTGSGYSTLNLLTGESRSVVTGPSTHGGLTTTEQDVQPTGPGSFVSTWTSTVANGDQLSGTASGTSSSPDGGIHVTVVGHYVSSGGTGRLADTSLTYDATAQLTLISVEGPIATYHVESTVVGTLSH